jgi:TolB-like protein/DNA-binding winged helix-turn-helix (wHTH) protein/Tfp pilus assembly protein PilF
VAGTTKRVYEFGRFRLDREERLLLRAGNPLPLTPKLFDTLLLLVENSGHLLSKDELMKRLWPDSFVDEVNLSQNVSRLRKVLEETPGERFIATVPGQGYRFVAQVRDVLDDCNTKALIIESHTRESVLVEEDEQPDSTEVSGSAQKRRSAIFPRLLWLIPIVLVAGIMAWFALRPKPDPVSDSIAVLPFDTASLDPDLEYLADGMIESTIDHLSRSQDLKVISFESVLPYRRRPISPQEIGRALGVRRIMTGRIVIQHERIIVLAELINTADGTHIWGEQYNRKLTDIINVQEDIAAEVSSRLKTGETREQQTAFRKRYTQDFEAYKLYIRGRHYWNKRDVQDLQRGLSYFQQAIDRDPTYALAYAGLADSYFVESAAGALSAEEGLPKAKAAASTALELDDSLAEAHASLAHIQFNYDWNWSEAEAEYKKAIALSPKYSYAHYFYGTFLLAMARNTEALSELRQAQELDPLSPMIATFIGKAYYFSRDNPVSIAQYRKVIQSNPGFPVAENFLVETLERSGSFAEALAQMDANNQGARDPFEEALHHAYQTEGAQGYLRERVRQIRLDPQGDRGGLSGGTAALYAVIGDKDEAFNALGRAYDRHELWLVYLRVDPVWDNLRSDPRFQSLLHRVGLV